MSQEGILIPVQFRQALNLKKDEEVLISLRDI